MTTANKNPLGISAAILSTLFLLLSNLFNFSYLHAEPQLYSCGEYMSVYDLVKAGTVADKYERLNQSDPQFKIPSFLFFGDSTLLNKWVFAKHIGLERYVRYIHQYDYTPITWKNMLNSTREDLRWADAIVWNQGLHKLHLLPERPFAGEIHRPEQFEALLRSMVEALKAAISRDTIILYKLTNSVCAEKYFGNYAVASNHWLNDPQYTMRSEYDMQMTLKGTNMLNYVEKKVMRSYNITMLNSFTAGACNCTIDARHYVNLGPNFVDRMISQADFLLHQQRYSLDNLAVTSRK